MGKRESKTDFDWQIDDLKLWWNSRPLIREAFSAEAVRYAVLHLMTGGNYRDITERVVREKLHIYHSWLLQVVHRARREYGKAWLKELLARLHEAQNRDKILADMRVWLLGLTHKTVQNLAVSKKDTTEIAAFIDTMLSLCDEVSKKQRWSEGTITIDLRNNPTGSVEKLDLTESLWFLQMVGAASLTVRGSNKAVYGKRLERAFFASRIRVAWLEDE